ncbi:MAG: hypothetical protein Q7S15_01155 [bacterium]|nr:hypothetical protein [bacterium]
MNATTVLAYITGKKTAYWSRVRETQALKTFHKAAQKVPAYKDFLKKHKIDASKIKTFKDFQNVPLINKENYLREYPFESLCIDGTLAQPLVFTSTSGSTGKPFYFCRSNEIDWQSSVAHELFYKNGFSKKELQTDSTLVIVCFGMGVWIGGLITYQAFEMLEGRKYPISIITPGINKDEIFKTLTNLAPRFKRLIFAGYPPFIKDIIDEAADKKINLKKWDIRIIFAAEAFTERFRDYIGRKANIDDIYTDTMNIYGSADIGTMAFETPTAILARRLILKRPALFNSVFGAINKTPTLAQYNPLFITFEAPGGEIVLTADNSLPLVRYSIGDHGGVFSYKELEDQFGKEGMKLERQLKSHKLLSHNYELPFVYVYERMDMSTTLYGLQIYPETIREVLLDNHINKFVTGKLTLASRYDKEQNQYLEINIELKKDLEIPDSVQQLISNKIVGNLLHKNSEFKELYSYLKERAVPKLVFWPAEHPVYFKTGIKQKWVEKV